MRTTTTDYQPLFLFSQLPGNQLLIMSKLLSDLSEEMEDYYRIQSQYTKKSKKSDYDDSKILDTLIHSHDYQSK